MPYFITEIMFPMKFLTRKSFSNLSKPTAYINNRFRNIKKQKRQWVKPLSFLLVRRTGLEPVRLPTRPSNVRVCQFRHHRKFLYFTKSIGICQLFLRRNRKIGINRTSARYPFDRTSISKYVKDSLIFKGQKWAKCRQKRGKGPLFEVEK